MTDLDFPDLASPAAESVHPPAYEGLVWRARARRRRHAVGAVAAAAVAVVAVVAVVTVAADRPTTPGPVDKPTPSVPTSPAVSVVDQVISEGQLWGVAGNDDGAITLWQRCRKSNRDCAYAWQLQQGPPSAGLLPGPGVWNVDAVGGRFVITDGTADSGGLVVELDGATTAIEDGEPRALTGDVALVRSTTRYVSGYGLVDAAAGVRWPLGRPDGVDGWSSAALGDDGQIWAFGTGTGHDTHVMLWHSADGGATWTQAHDLTTGAPPMPGYVVASGRHVAALATFDGATVLPVGDLAVTSDDGASWRDLNFAAVPFEFVDSMAATDGGTLYIAGGAMEGGPMRLYRSTDDTWTHFAEVDLSDGEQIDDLRSAGASVIGRTGSLDRPELVSLGDDGSVQPWTGPLR